MTLEVILFCPQCRRQHIDPADKEEHSTHDCYYCYTVWTPSTVCTKGVCEIPEEYRSERDTWPPNDYKLYKEVSSLIKQYY